MYEAQYDRRMARQNYPMALQAIQLAVQYDDNTARRWLKLGEVELAVNQAAGAASAFQRALDLEPDSVEALENLAILSVRGGNYDNTKRYVDTLLILQPNDGAGLLASGALALAQRRFPDAMAVGDKVIASAPDRADGYVLKARALDAAGKSTDAVALLKARTDIDPSNSDLLTQLLLLQQKRGDKAGIQDTAIKLMRVFPDDPRYAMESARAYHGRGQDDLANEIIARLQEKYAHNAPMMTTIANYWRDALPPTAARARIAQVAAAAPPGVRSALADMLIGMGYPADAIGLLASLAPAMITSANIDSQTHYARALLAVGQIAQAEAKVNAALDFDSANPEALVLRSRLKLMRKDYFGAATDAQLVATDDDSNEEAALLLGEIYAKQGSEILAASAYGSAREKFPDSTKSLRAEANWLISQKHTLDAQQRAAAFAHAHPHSGDGWLLYRQLCAVTKTLDCQFDMPNIRAHTS